MSEREALKRMVDEAAQKLSEHCDSVRILVTRHAPDGDSDTTTQYDCGRGNFYAQLGQVREWLEIQEQHQRNWAIKKDAES